MEFILEIEEMAMEADTLRSMTLATYDAIYNGCTGYEEFEGQLHAVFCMANEHMKHLKTLKDEMFAMKRKERNGGENVC